ncbi:MAG: acyl-CoA thioesterase domain-containing protein [Acidimicrobiales bacterium]
MTEQASPGRMTVLPDQPVFARPAARRFVPGPLAAGPFAGLQGGGVAGVMATSMEEAAPKGMEALSIRADFLRPAAPEPIDVDVELVRTGRSRGFPGSDRVDRREADRARRDGLRPTDRIVPRVRTSH